MSAESRKSKTAFPSASAISPVSYPNSLGNRLCLHQPLKATALCNVLLELNDSVDVWVEAILLARKWAFLRSKSSHPFDERILVSLLWYSQWSMNSFPCTFRFLILGSIYYTVPMTKYSTMNLLWQMLSYATGLDICKVTTAHFILICNLNLTYRCFPLAEATRHSLLE